MVGGPVSITNKPKETIRIKRRGEARKELGTGKVQQANGVPGVEKKRAGRKNGTGEKHDDLVYYQI